MPEKKAVIVLKKMSLLNLKHIYVYNVGIILSLILYTGVCHLSNPNKAFHPLWSPLHSIC